MSVQEESQRCPKHVSRAGHQPVVPLVPAEGQHLEHGDRLPRPACANPPAPGLLFFPEPQ